MNALEQELYHSFLFFLRERNSDLTSPGVGLIRDNTKNRSMASIASVGFGLSAFVIGVENHYITKEEGLELVKSTMRTFLEAEHFHGFYVHFLDMDTAKPFKKSEFSTIDTAILMNGLLVADSYFDDPEIHQMFDVLFQRLDFRPFVKTFHEKEVLRMAYNPHVGGDYRQVSDDPWIYQWHMYAEQLSMYFLAAATDSMPEETARALYHGFERNLGTYGPYQYYYSPTNALFVYQYSHAWVDFKHIQTDDGIDWFENSRIASLANRLWCIDHQQDFPTLNQSAWGVTACLTPKGYRNQCIDPNDLNFDDIHVHGVFPPSGPLGSIVFTPNESLEALEELEMQYQIAKGPYGFRDGIQLQEDGSLWVSEHDIGINKGITCLMIDNYLHGTTWKYYMRHPRIQKAMAKLHFQRRD